MTTRFDSSKSLEQTLINNAKVSSQHIPQKAPRHMTPIQALKNWAHQRPELFKTRVYALPRLDTPA